MLLFFFQTILNIYNDIARKYGNVTVKDFRKYEKLEYKNNKLKLDIDFLNNCKQLGVYPEFLIFKLPNVSNKDAQSIRKRLFLVFPKTFYLNSFLLSTSTFLQNL